MEQHRFIEVNWADEHNASYNAEIQIVARDRQALLADITNAIAEIMIDVTAINARTTRNRRVVINLCLEIHDKKQLERVMKFFRRLEDVEEVYRVNA